MIHSDQRLRIVVTGLIAQHPTLGGVAWDYVQYVDGLRRLGHDVYYFEDSGQWPYTIDGGPTKEDWIAYDCSPNVRHLAAVMARFGLADRWAYRFPIKPRWFGLSHNKRREVLETADLLINVSGTLKRPSDYRSICRLAYVDSDPGFTQTKLALQRGQKKFQHRAEVHDTYFSFGELMQPVGHYHWQPTRQPIVLSEWTTPSDPGPAYTTVMSWASYKPLRYGGRRYGQKDVEFRRFLDLPRTAPQVRFEVALNATQNVTWEFAPAQIRRVRPQDLLWESGWHVVDAHAACADLDAYRAFVQGSRAEWSVAKNGYVTAATGWFSCRSACYLAAGRPVVVQDTGFSRVIPTGAGVLTFTTLDEAAAAVAEVEADYARHARAARDIAGAYFDARQVLSDLVEHAMTVDRGRELAGVGA
jgi:hypothetical protein